MVVIVNPQAGRGKVGAELPGIERVLTDGGLEYRIVRTTHPGHATQAAREALEGGARYLVAAGGDGTIHEVVNGMMDGDRPVATDAVLGVLASGSGCDFVKSFGLPTDAVEGARHLAGEQVRRIDVGKVTCAAGPAETVRYFPNIAQAGLGAAVVARACALPGFLGPAKYFWATWLALPGFHAAAVRIDADGQAVQWRAHNVVVANCRFYGGGMQISPKSEPDDGALDVLVMVGPKSGVFAIVPKVYRGAHLPHRNIAELRARRVRIETDPPFPVEADGEIVGTTPATFEVIPTPIQVKV
jgi:YegS/Rv2252/BmrU family lipid kinase